MHRFLPLLLLPLVGCTHPATGDMGLETPHQPLVSADGAFVPGCPDWATSGKPGHEGQSSNYGCATMSNLAAMIADPQDLLHGKGDGTSSGEMAAKAIKTWRETAPTSKLWQTTIGYSNGSGGGGGGPK